MMMMGGTLPMFHATIHEERDRRSIKRIKYKQESVGH